jgi:hypothetical protein
MVVGGGDGRVCRAQGQAEQSAEDVFEHDVFLGKKTSMLLEFWLYILTYCHWGCLARQLGAATELDTQGRSLSKRNQ